MTVQGLWSNEADGGVGSCSDGSPDYTYTALVTGVSPTTAAAGSTVTVTGENLGTASEVLFDGTPGVISSDSPTEVTAVVPTGAGNGVVSVVTTYGTVASAKAVDLSPALTSFAPTAVAPDGTLTLTGSGLGAVRKVEVGGKKAVVISDTDVQIVVTVAAKARSGSVEVATKYGSSTLGGLTVS